MPFLPLDPLTLLAVFVFTFLFDIIDLKPQIGSFSFLKSLTYFAYYSLRVVFGVLAAVLLQPTEIFQHSLLLAFGAVVTAVSTLQNFSLKISGQDIADLSSLFDQYRQTMIDNELNQASQKAMTEQAQLVFDLANRSDKNSLWKHCLVCLRTLHQKDANSTQKVDKKMDEIKRIGGQDEDHIKMLLAMEIVNINPEYAKQLLSG